jgi:hypothetical protein
MVSNFQFTLISSAMRPNISSPARCTHASARGILHVDEFPWRIKRECGTLEFDMYHQHAGETLHPIEFRLFPLDVQKT